MWLPLDLIERVSLAGYTLDGNMILRGSFGFGEPSEPLLLFDCPERPDTGECGNAPSPYWPVAKLFRNLVLKYALIAERYEFAIIEKLTLKLLVGSNGNMD